MTADDLDALARSGDSGAYVAERSRDWLRLWTEDLGAPGFNPFDTLAVAWLSHPELLEHFVGPVRIEPGPDARDASPPLLVVEHDDPQAAAGRRARYCQRPHPDFKPLLLRRLAAPYTTDPGREGSP
jgi:hypothetical protein